MGGGSRVQRRPALVLGGTGFAGGTLAYRHGVGVARDCG